jgi:hypothetical protein
MTPELQKYYKKFENRAELECKWAWQIGTVAGELW